MVCLALALRSCEECERSTSTLPRNSHIVMGNTMKLPWELLLKAELDAEIEAEMSSQCCQVPKGQCTAVLGQTPYILT